MSNMDAAQRSLEKAACGYRLRREKIEMIPSPTRCSTAGLANDPSIAHVQWDIW